MLKHYSLTLLIALIAMSATVHAVTNVRTVTSSEVNAARLKCLTAPSSQKARLCAAWKKLEALQSSAASVDQAQLAAAQRECESAPWSRKAAACAEYSKLKALLASE